MLARIGTSLGAAVAASALLAAIASVWLVLTDPVAVADAVSSRGGQAFFEAVVGVIVDAVEQLLRWL